MKPVGIVSIPLAQTPGPHRSFSALMGAAGNNTGNLLFTNAVWEQISDPKVRINFNFDPKKINTEYRALVFPAANWFGAHVDFTYLADLVEQLDIPVVLIGLGTQDEGYSGDVSVPDGTVRFVRAVADRSNSISVRGEYTKLILESYGIRKVTVTGCPSLYPVESEETDNKLLRAAEVRSGHVLLHSTRYLAQHRPFVERQSLHRELFRLAYRSRTDLLFQSEPEEISLLVDAAQKPPMDDPVKSTLLEIYGAKDWSDFDTFVQTHGKVFFDTIPWKRAMTGYGCAFGTRLHATIMALNSGTPAILAHHDSRTREMCEFAGIPNVEAHERYSDLDSIKSAFAATDFRRFLDIGKVNRERYEQFLSDNALSPS